MLPVEARLLRCFEFIAFARYLNEVWYEELQ
jgi:hypothetical protein